MPFKLRTNAQGSVITIFMFLGMGRVITGHYTTNWGGATAGTPNRRREPDQVPATGDYPRFGSGDNTYLTGYNVETFHTSRRLRRILDASKGAVLECRY